MVGHDYAALRYLILMRVSKRPYGATSSYSESDGFLQDISAM